MIIRLGDNNEIDTDCELSSEERHVLQKLIGWKVLVTSEDQFRQKKKSALEAGWNNSGPIRPSHKLNLILEQFEKELQLRLKK